MKEWKKEEMLQDFLSNSFYQAPPLTHIMFRVFFLKQIFVLFSYQDRALRANDAVFVMFVNFFLCLFLINHKVTVVAPWRLLALAESREAQRLKGSPTSGQRWMLSGEEHLTGASGAAKRVEGK